MLRWKLSSRTTSLPRKTDITVLCSGEAVWLPLFTVCFHLSTIGGYYESILPPTASSAKQAGTAIRHTSCFLRGASVRRTDAAPDTESRTAGTPGTTGHPHSATSVNGADTSASDAAPAADKERNHPPQAISGTKTCRGTPPQTAARDGSRAYRASAACRHHRCDPFLHGQTGNTCIR